MFLREFLLPQPAINSKPSRSAQNPPTVPHDLRTAMKSAERIAPRAASYSSMHLSVSFDAVLRRLKELDYVARRVYAKNLFAPPLLHNVVPELHTIVLQLGDEGPQIVNSQDEPRPASRLGRGAIWH